MLCLPPPTPFVPCRALLLACCSSSPLRGTHFAPQLLPTRAVLHLCRTTWSRSGAIDGTPRCSRVVALYPDVPLPRRRALSPACCSPMPRVLSRTVVAVLSPTGTMERVPAK
ncbi:hypothetical protein SETIT_2G297400v2 [Setaria italica]|uniref:Uncharacterized protein n=1 Tax=Setaria italica TaxID=4555 RepID=A0A368Q6C5_SETIT|nr:hypothetical protein SETIT_2G297400v2 [Setaria italica]